MQIKSSGDIGVTLNVKLVSWNFVKGRDTVVYFHHLRDGFGYDRRASVEGHCGSSWHLYLGVDVAKAMGCMVHALFSHLDKQMGTSLVVLAPKFPSILNCGILQALARLVTKL